MDLNENNNSKDDSVDIEIVEEVAVAEAQNTMNTNPTRPEEIDHGPFVQFESSVVGVHNDDLAEKFLNDVFDPPIKILIGDGNKHILKHGIILEQSPFFRNVLKNTKKKSVDLTEFDSSAVQSLVIYLYTGKLNISKANVEKLLLAADKFELIDVKKKCIQVIQDSLDSNNSFDVRKFAKSYGIPSLLKSADAFIAKELSRLTSSQFFLALGSDEILELLDSCPRGTIPSSTEFSAILAWVQHDETNRESHLPQLMRHLNLDDLLETAPQLLEVPFGRDGILARNNECLLNYAEALKRRASRLPGPSRKRRRDNVIKKVENFSGEMRPEDSEWLERADHPLLQQEILHSVFPHLRKEDLKVCRLVCKTWSVLTIPFTRKAFNVTIYGNPWNTSDKAKIYGVENFVKVFRSNNFGIPFARYQLETFCTTDGFGQEFLKLCGDTTKEIRFLPLYENATVEDISEILQSTPALETFQIPSSFHSRSENVVKLFPHGLENSKSKLTSLKTLILPFERPTERDYEDRMKGRNSCPTFMEELVTAAQNISCFSTSHSYSRKGFEVMSLIERLDREPFIQELRMRVPESDYDEFAVLLHKMSAKPNGLRLKRFAYASRDSKQDRLALQLIPHFKDTLEFLELDLDETPRLDFIKFPKMPRLKSLFLSWYQNFKFTRVNFNEAFPVLRELELQMGGKTNTSKFFLDSVPCPNMKALKLDSASTSDMTINAFYQMITVFPNLTQLKIEIKLDGVKDLREIWSQLTQLKSLDICVEIKTLDSMDCALTGFSTQALEEMSQAVYKLERMVTSSVERREIILKLRSQHFQHPSIGNLTSLRSLAMRLTREGKCNGPGSFLTDLSGYFGFYPMERLHHLNLLCCELTQTCCEILRQDMELEGWELRSKAHKHIITSAGRFDLFTDYDKF